MKKRKWYRDELERDPIAELRRIRDENAKKYPTVEELFAYLDTTPSWEEIHADLQRQVAKRKAKRKAKLAARPVPEIPKPLPLIFPKDE